MNLNQIKYSRGQQIVFVILAIFIVGCCFIDSYLGQWLNDNKPVEEEFTLDSTLVAEIEAFEKGLDSIVWKKEFDFKPPIRIIKDIERERFVFDPNTIDSVDIIRLGFQPFMAHNWLQYRRHDGKFYSIRKLRTIYGIDTLLVDSLKDYITFASVKPEITKDTIVYKRKEFFSFEINSADTALLKKLPGIGEGRATMIVARRRELGGFYSAEQIREIDNIPDSIVDALMPYISVELDSIKKIDLNNSGMKRWKQHPYIGYYRAKDIYDLKWDAKHKGKITDLEEIRELEHFTDEDFERIKNYLTIE